MTNPLVSVYASVRTFLADRAVALKNRSDRGAGFIEYAGVLIVIGAIAAVAYNAIEGDEEGIGNTIKEGIEGAIESAFDEADASGLL
ncbi:hypothetical protein [Halostreptopolyspora alba]|uniref:Uncharacterized protein n=1 Tax=Halostreptopolyspora alba TaxID=2487137 RepID=A0A3N0E6L7_9ACTN|nr:hypothetical protein EFW17_15945 [Nocardiopsaceae bacterium YIM 96095]